jgi:hypothetical protein
MSLNIRELFAPLFFDRNVRHTDMKRQRSRRLRAQQMRAARALKHQYVPLCSIVPPERLELWKRW